jgi:hypothetical protein
VKNSDCPRTLLEALLLRFALAEHFLNVEQLLGQANVASPASVKKNVRSLSNASPKNTSAAVVDKPKVKVAGDISSVKINWPQLLEVITSELGNGTGGLLSHAAPVSLDNDTLTLSFTNAHKVSKNLCESNGRRDQIQGCLSAHFSRPVKVEFVIEEQARQDEKEQKTVKSPSQKRQEIMNDPAVKNILTELNATITNIEEQ